MSVLAYLHTWYPSPNSKSGSGFDFKVLYLRTTFISADDLAGSAENLLERIHYSVSLKVSVSHRGGDVNRTLGVDSILCG